MKQISKFFLIISFSGFVLGSALLIAIEFDLDFEAKKLKTENLIRDQIKSHLASILDEKDFNIVVDSEFVIKEVKKKSEKKSIMTNLPGFSDDKVEGEKNKDLAKEKTKINSYLEIKKVLATLYLEGSLSEGEKKLAREIVTEKIKKSYGLKGEVSFKEENLRGKIDRSFTESISFYFTKNKDIIIVFSVFIFVFLLLVFLFSRIMSSRDLQNMKAMKSSGSDSSGGRGSSSMFFDEGSSDIKKEEYIAELMAFVRDDPFVTKSSLDSVSLKEKSSVIFAAETDLLKKTLLSLMDLKESDLVQVKDHGVIKKNLKLVLEKIKENIAIQKVLAGQEFWYLNFLPPKEIIKFLGDKRTTKELSIVSQYLPSSKYYEFSKLLDEKTKVEIFKSLNNKENNIKDQDKKDLNEKFKKCLESISDKTLYFEGSDEEALDNFLNFDPKIAGVINTLKKDSNFKPKKDLDKYSFDFVSLLKEKFEEVFPILLEEENDIVAASLVNLDEEVKNSVLNSFGKLRKEIMEDLLRTSSCSDEEIDQAQAKIMKSYREKI